MVGDFNADGTVDASDYIVWRKRLGTTHTQADYDTWRARFGQTAASAAANSNLPSAPGSAGGSSPSVPEPQSLASLCVAAACWLILARGRRPAKNRC